MRIVGLTVVVALSFASLHARADNAKAWSAAKLGLPADTKVVVGFDLAALQKTKLFSMLYPKLLERSGEGLKLFEAFKTACKIDLLAAVHGVVLAAADTAKDAAVYASMGIDKAKLSSCMPLATKSVDATSTVSIKHDGNVTQLSDGKTTVFLGWVGKDVMVVPINAEDKTALARWMGGKGALAKSTLGKALAKVNTSAALWGAIDKPTEVQPGITMKVGYGAVTFARGNLDAKLHAVTGNASHAQTLASSTKKQLDEAKQGAQMPLGMADIMKGITVAAVNDEVVVKASFVEAELASFVMFALASMGAP